MSVTSVRERECMDGKNRTNRNADYDKAGAVSVMRRYWPALGGTLLLVLVLFYVLYLAVRLNFLKEVKNHAEYVAQCATAGLHEQDILAVRSETDVTTDAYRRLIRHLESFKAAAKDVRYMYIVRKHPSMPRHFVYVADLPVAESSNAASGRAAAELPGKVYDASPYPAMLEGWSHTTSDPDVSPDPPYPDLLSAYSPVRNSAGEVIAMLGLDITADTIQGKLMGSRVIILVYGLLLAVLISIIVFFYCGRQITLEKIAVMNDELAVKNAQLEKLLDLRNKLSQMIVHDLRNPLAVINGYTALLMMDKSINETQRDFLRNIEQQTNRAVYFLEDMLLMAKYESGRLLLDLTPSDPRTCVEQCVRRNEVLSQMVDVRISCEIPKESPPDVVPFDRGLLTRILDNLLTNAIKHSPGGTGISVRFDFFSKADGSHFRIKVHDAGRGVPEEKRASLFQTFNSQDSGVNKISHSFGLGLAFCQMAVEAHKGSIALEQTTVGACFVVEI
jgi:signal transduction histidine kinase